MTKSFRKPAAKRVQVRVRDVTDTGEQLSCMV